MSDEPRKGLGRGLSALLGDESEGLANQEQMRATHTVPIEQISPSKFQPRKRFDDQEIAAAIGSNPRFGQRQ